MAKDKTATGKPHTVGITIRVDAELNRRFGAILTLKNDTVTGFLNRCIEKYVEENYQDAIALLEVQKKGPDR